MVLVVKSEQHPFAAACSASALLRCPEACCSAGAPAAACALPLAVGHAAWSCCVACMLLGSLRRWTLQPARLMPAHACRWLGPQACLPPPPSRMKTSLRSRGWAKSG